MRSSLKLKTGFRTKQEAEEFAHALQKKALVEKYNLAPPEPRKFSNRVTVGEAVEEYLKYRKDKIDSRKKSANPHKRTFNSADNKLLIWMEVIGAGREVRTITHHDLTAWVAHEKKRGTLTSGSISRSLNTIRACLRFISERREELSNWRVPKKPLGAEANTHRSRPLEEEEIKALAKVLSSNEEYRDAYDFMRIALGTASRLDEILSLRWEDVESKTKVIRLYASKTQKEKILHLPAVASIIEARKRDGLGNDIFVFTCRDHWLRKMLKRAAEEAKIEYGWGKKNGFVIHDLRGTALSALLGAGVDLPTVSKTFAAHHSIQQTTIYLNPTLKSKKEATIAADNLVNLATRED